MFRKSQSILGALLLMTAWCCAAAQSPPANNLQQGAAAQESVEELTKRTQNPVADIIKVQFQNYFNFGMGTNKVTQYAQQIVTTIPFKLNEDWNLITRTDLPIINQPSAAFGSQSAFGIGDLNPTFYLVPRKHRAVTWGVGPSFTHCHVRQRHQTWR